jgi:hypothetical protein
MFPTGYNNNVQILQAPGVVTDHARDDARHARHPARRRPHSLAAFGSTWATPGPAGRDDAGRRRHQLSSHDSTTIHPSPTRRAGRAHLIERYTRTAADAMRYEVTVDDPHTFERPWTAVLDLAPQKDMYEYACHEGTGAGEHPPGRPPRRCRRGRGGSSPKTPPKS